MGSEVGPLHMHAHEHTHACMQARACVHKPECTHTHTHTHTPSCPSAALPAPAGCAARRRRPPCGPVQYVTVQRLTRTAGKRVHSALRSAVRRAVRRRSVVGKRGVAEQGVAEEREMTRGCGRARPAGHIVMGAGGVHVAPTSAMYGRASGVQHLRTPSRAVLQCR